MKRIIIIFVSLIIVVSLVVSVIYFKKNSSNDENNNIELVEKSKEDRIKELKEYRAKADNEKINYRNDIEVGEDILGEEAKEYLTHFDEQRITVDILIRDNLVEMIPYPDFVETQKIYYKNGKLAMFVYISNTIGGEVVYYFDNDNLLDYEVNYEENVEYKQIDTKVLIDRANIIYNKYINIKYEFKTEKLSKNITDDNGVVVYDIIYEYPIIISNENKEIENVNSKIKNFVEEKFNKIDIEKEKNNLIKKYNDYTSNFLSGEVKAPFTNELKLEVKYNKNHIISFYVENYIFTGGSYPVRYTEGVTYDLLTGDNLSLEKYLKLDETKINNAVVNKFVNKYVKGSADDITTKKELERNIKFIHYYFTNEGIYFFFEEDVIAPHAVGEPYVLIPYTEFK